MARTWHKVLPGVRYGMDEQLVQNDWERAKEWCYEHLVSLPNPDAFTRDGLDGMNVVSLFRIDAPNGEPATVIRVAVEHDAGDARVDSVEIIAWDEEEHA